MYYTVIKHSSHLRTLKKCRKHSPAARAFYISLVFSNACRVLSQCNTRLRLLYLLNIRCLFHSIWCFLRYTGCFFHYIRCWFYLYSVQTLFGVFFIITAANVIIQAQCLTAIIIHVTIYIQLSNPFLIGRKPTANFRNQRS